LYSSISGLTAHQTKMDVVGNNIANVNTTGFKKSSVNFEEAMTRTLQGARGPVEGRGGSNPIALGLGAKVASVNTNFESGAQQTTGRKTDLRIDGKGFFIVQEGDSKLFTRSGNFNLDGDGTLVTATGKKVQGWQATKKADGSMGIDSTTPLGDLAIKVGAALPGKSTDTVNYTGNLQQKSGISNLSMSVDDLSGTGTKTDIEVSFSYDKENDKWFWKADGPGVIGQGAFQLDSDGNIKKGFPNETVPIQNANGVLVNSPIAGQITFSEIADVNNKKTAGYMENAFVTSSEVYDSLGNTHTLGVKYTKLSENVWDWEAIIGDGQPTENSKGFVTFDSVGQINGKYLYANPADPLTWPEGVGSMYFESGVVDPATGQVDYGDVNSEYVMDGNGVIKFNGEFVAGGPVPGQVMNQAFDDKVTFGPAADGSAPPPDGGAAPVEISMNFNGVTQFAAQTSVTLESQNGYGMGELETFNINDDGSIQGFYSNGYEQIIGKIGLAKFNNPEGLQNLGGSSFAQSSNSGEAMILTPGAAGTGGVVAGALEMSNVDLAQEFTDMIIAQRGFQANSKTISAADQILQDVISLKR
jgi:flagellar hook protein FlgE